MMETKVLGDYNLIKQIGQGALGTVYLAEHRFMKKQFVLKVLPEEISADRAFIQRFEEEINLLSSLEHPHIVKIHHISFTQGQYFLVMDCIVDELGEATNLSQYITGRGNDLDEEEILRLLTQIADALDYAHSKKAGTKGIVHRGIKLNNILVGKGFKGKPDLFLSDFGLTRIVGTGAVLTRTYKNVAETLGIGAVAPHLKAGSERYPSPPIDTPKLLPLHLSFLQNFVFLAPEQKRLDHPKGVDVKADVYAFGVLAYYLLMKEFPEGVFEMPSDRKGMFQYQWDELLRDCLRSDPTKRPDVLLDSLNRARSTMPYHAVKESVSQDFSPPIAELDFTTDFIIEQRVIRPVDPDTYRPSLKPVIRVAELERPTTDPDPSAIFNIDTNVKFYQPENKEVKNIQPLLTDMVVVQGGVFKRGSNDGNRDEMPRHAITLTSFAIDIHPVTNEQFVRFLEAMGGEKDSNHHDIIRMRDSRIKRSGGKLSIESGYSKHPVVGVTWYGAIAYAKWIGKRLPTEAEWEIAARGGIEEALFPTGDDIEKTQANFFSSDTTAVMSYTPNPCGIYDMPGNVYEWCYDWYGYNYYEISVQEPENPKGPLQGVYRVLRGGCWKSLKEDLRCSRRHRNNPGTVNGTYGFRCAADVQ
jgi:formylglycine-generating enzyme required for sulfatase activity